MPTYKRNIHGRVVELELTEVDPLVVKLDPTNPRVGFSMRQLDEAQRNDDACTLLLTSQEDTEVLKRSIVLSNGVQEPIYVRADGRVAEGNRRVVAVRAAQEEFPGDAHFERIPAWLIPADTPEPVIQDLLNEIHLGSVRGWAPYEKALQMRALVDGGLIEEEVAERYRITAREVRQQLAAVEMMDTLYFPITDEPADPENRTKFSYFLEFHKNTRLRTHCGTTPNLPERFAGWVKMNRIDTGAKVRRLPKILDSREATRLLEVVGFDAAEEYLEKLEPANQELYALIERARSRLADMTVTELVELRESEDRREILSSLRREATRVLESIEQASRSA